MDLSLQDNLICSYFEKFNKFFFDSDFLFLISDDSENVKVFEFSKKISYCLFVGFNIVYLFVSPFIFQKMNVIFFIGINEVLIFKFSLKKCERIFQRIILLDDLEFFWEKIIFINSNEFFVKDSGGYIHIYALNN